MELELDKSHSCIDGYYFNITDIFKGNIPEGLREHILNNGTKVHVKEDMPVGWFEYSNCYAPLNPETGMYWCRKRYISGQSLEDWESLYV